MSKIGKKPIILPSDVTCNINNKTIVIKGKNSELSMDLSPEVNIEVKDNQIIVSPKNASLDARRMWGTIRASINNMILGVSQGFTKSLEINGVGYRMAVKGKDLVLNLGFSHEVVFPIPDTVNVVCPDATHVNIKGVNKQIVGLIASKIKLMKKPEPYKGKGFKYVGEQILRKEGKKK